jgi:hypothetical protein
MTDINVFTKEERDLLVALPYRTGLWLSQCDDAGGHEASGAELEALDKIVLGYSEDFLKAEFIETLMREGAARHEEWEKWRENVANVPDECKQAIDILAAKADRKSVAAFKKHLMEIARAVAMAHREFEEDMNLSDRLWIYRRYVRGWMQAYLKKEPYASIEELLSISRIEDEALNKLAQALRVGVEEGLPVQPDAAAA